MYHLLKRWRWNWQLLKEFPLPAILSCSRNTNLLLPCSLHWSDSNPWSQCVAQATVYSGLSHNSLRISDMAIYWTCHWEHTRFLFASDCCQTLQTSQSLQSWNHLNLFKSINYSHKKEHGRQSVRYCFIFIITLSILCTIYNSPSPYLCHQPHPHFSFFLLSFPIVIPLTIGLAKFI